MAHIWVRDEKNPFEKRTFLIPSHAKLLVSAGHRVSIEHSLKRIYSDDEYEKCGCKIVPTNSWQEAPSDTYILGIKGVKPARFPISHTHICFAYIYDNQKSSLAMLERFKKGNGLLLDLEFLQNSIGIPEVTKSAGFFAGICGAMISLLIDYQKKTRKRFPYSLPLYYNHLNELIEDISKKTSSVQTPSILIIGKNGMVAKGAKYLLEKISIPYTGWSRDDTQEKGPFCEILNYNILLNCINVSSDTSVFLTEKLLKKPNQLSVIGDITCDPTHPNNPLPFYKKPTTFTCPTIKIKSNKMVDLMSIDNIPTLLPYESSKAMSSELFPHLCALLMANKQLEKTLWGKCKKKFINEIKKR